MYKNVCLPRQTEPRINDFENNGFGSEIPVLSPFQTVRGNEL